MILLRPLSLILHRHHSAILPQVILGTHSILADGGLQSVAGSHMIAVAASHHSGEAVVPVLTLVHLFSFTWVWFACSVYSCVAPKDDDDLIGRFENGLLIRFYGSQRDS